MRLLPPVSPAARAGRPGPSGHEESNSRAPARGKSIGRWTITVRRRAMGDERIRLGVVGVDSASLLVIDPLYLRNWDHGRSFQEIVDHIGEGPGLQLESAPGVVFKSGFGDGSYEVWATVREFEPPWGKR